MGFCRYIEYFKKRISFLSVTYLNPCEIVQGNLGKSQEFPRIFPKKSWDSFVLIGTKFPRILRNFWEKKLKTVPRLSGNSQEFPRIYPKKSGEFFCVNWHKIPGNSQEFLGKEMKNCSPDFLRIPGKSWEFLRNGCNQEFPGNPRISREFLGFRIQMRLVNE